jgi:aldose 1-epimerase
MTLPLTGTQYDIAAGDYEATVTELGAGLRQLSLAGRPLITSYDADHVPPAGAGQLLAPWPNRVADGQYAAGGASYQLDLSEPAHHNAIHGLTRFSSWELVSQQPDAVELGLDLLGHSGYPFRLRLQAGFRLSAASGLEVTITAANPGSRPAPYGTGSHPYLLAGTGEVDSWQLQVPAGQWLPSDDRGLPSGPPREVAGSEFDFRDGRAIGEVVLDTAFTGLQAGPDGRVQAVLTGPQAQVRLWAGEGYGWLQVFTGDTLGPDAKRRAVAIEPMTCPPNAMATGTDLLMIAPGESVTRQWGIQAQLR